MCAVFFIICFYYIFFLIYNLSGHFHWVGLCPFSNPDAKKRYFASVSLARLWLKKCYGDFNETLSLLASFMKSTSILACETNLSKKGAHFWFCSSTIGFFPLSLTTLYISFKVSESEKRSRMLLNHFWLTVCYGRNSEYHRERC